MRVNGVSKRAIQSAQNLDVADMPISELFLPEAGCHTAPARWVGLHQCGRLTRRLLSRLKWGAANRNRGGAIN